MYRFGLFYKLVSRKGSLANLADDLGISRRTLDRWFDPFWHIKVPHPETQRVYDQIFLDATHMGRSRRQCLLVAHTTKGVVDWEWCDAENTDNYLRLLDRITPPRIATCDGHKGVIKAIRIAWPNAQIQRCLVHVRRDIERCTTKNPITEPNKKLRVLGKTLTSITTPEQASQWAAALQDFYTKYKSHIYARTYRCDVPADQVPKRAKNNKVWWWTHLRTKRGYELLANLFRNGTLFVYLGQVDEDGEPIKNNTNPLEGGINSHVKEYIHVHRGMPHNHVRTMVDWWLLAHSVTRRDPYEIAREQKWGIPACQREAAKKQGTQESDPIGPVMYDDGIDTTIWNDELAIRKGKMS